MTIRYNRQLLNNIVPTEPVWLKQVYGAGVIDAALSCCIESANQRCATNLLRKIRMLNVLLKRMGVNG